MIVNQIEKISAVTNCLAFRHLIMLCHKELSMQQLIVADSLEFQADLQRKLDKLKQEIIAEVKNTIDNKKEEPKYLTRFEVSQKYRISLVTLHSLTVKMKLNSIKIGKRRLYEAGQLDRFFNGLK